MYLVIKLFLNSNYPSLASSMRSSDLSANSLNLSPSSCSDSGSNSCSNSGNFSDSPLTPTSTNATTAAATTATTTIAPFRDTPDTVAFAFDNLTYASSADDVLDLDYQGLPCTLSRVGATQSESSSSFIGGRSESEGIWDSEATKPTESQLQATGLRKNLKSIKRKDRMKKKGEEPAMSARNFGHG